MSVEEILSNLGPSSEMISFSILSLLKLPLLLLLIGNVLFSILLFLRVRILADTFKSPQNKIVKTVVLIYMFIVLIISLLSLLFAVLT